MSAQTLSAAWIATASDVRLALVHRDHDRRLGLPNAELWAEEYAERKAEMAAIWAEIQARKAGSQPVKRRAA